MNEKGIKPKIFSQMKKQKGITLIALIITIIILLILAGVVIAILTGNNNIIANTNRAVGVYDEKAGEEEITLNLMEQKMIEYTQGSTEETLIPLTGTANVNESGLANEKTLIKPDADSNLQIVIPAGFAPAVLTGGNNPGQNGSVASILAADQWKNITTEQINQGIVIVDHAITYTDGVPDFNEYVWVPITGSGRNIFAPYAWTTGTNTTPQNLSSSGYWDDTTTDEYTNMVTSISGNKGFYISRYKASDNGSNVAQSKRGQTPWTSVAQTAAITASTNANPTVHTHLMYGVEWDSTLNWLIDNATISSSTAGATKPMGVEDIQTNSRSWGNYFNSAGDAATNSGSERNTGYSEYWKANNIYDLAGNVYEWTQEKYSTGSHRAYRGGRYYDAGGNFPAAFRSYFDETHTDSGRRVPFQLLLVALNSGSEAQCK